MEEDDLNFSRAELLSLEDLSVIAAAAGLWESPDMKREMKNFLDADYPGWRSKTAYVRKDPATPYLRKASSEISDALFRDLNDLRVPEIFHKKIQNKVLEMGDSIFDWTMYLTQDLKLDFKYVDKIYWTPDGQIDEDKIFKCFWRDYLVGRSFEGEAFDQNLQLLYYLACFFAEKDFIISFQTDRFEDINSIAPSAVGNDTVFRIMKNVICSSDMLHIWNLITNRNFIVGLGMNWTSTAEVMNICILRSLYKPFVYFWNYLDATERFDYLEEKSNCNLYNFMKVYCYGKENLLKILLFLINEMNAAQKDDFILINFNFLFCMFLKKERFRKFCIPLLNKFLSQLQPYRIYNLMIVCVRNMTSIAYKDSAFQILEFLMEKVPKQDKAGVVHFNNREFISYAFKIFDIPTLKLIINDNDLQSYRDDMINFGVEKFKLLIQNNNFHLLNGFMDEVLMSKYEKNKFMERCYFLEEWIVTGQFDAIDNFLDWRHGDQARKTKIELYHLYCHLVPKDHDSIDKLLKWYLGTHIEPLINDCENKSVVKKFCRELIYNMWFRSHSANSIDEVVEISTRILMSVFGSEEEIVKFKVNELANNASCVNFFCGRIVLENSIPRESEPRFYVVDQFFNFCLLPAEKIDHIKKLIADNIHKWIMEYGVNERRFNIVVPLLDWIYGNEASNCKRLVRYFPNPVEVISYYNGRIL